MSFALSMLDDYPVFDLGAPTRSPTVDELEAFDQFAGVSLANPTVMMISLPMPEAHNAFLRAVDVLPEYHAAPQPAKSPAEIRLEAVAAGERFVQTVARVALFTSDSDAPWSNDAQQLVELWLSIDRHPVRPFLFGVMRHLREAKQVVDQRLIAGGFCVLAATPLGVLRRALPGVDFGKTCDAGCQFGGSLVPKAAVAARVALGFAA